MGKKKQSNTKLGSVNLARGDNKDSTQPISPPKIELNENTILSSPAIRPTSPSQPLPNQPVWDTPKQQTSQSNLVNTQESKLGEPKEYET